MKTNDSKLPPTLGEQADANWKKITPETRAVLKKASVKWLASVTPKQYAPYAQPRTTS